MKTLQGLVSSIDKFQGVVNTNVNYLENLIVSVDNFYDDMVDYLITELRVSYYAVESLVGGVTSILEISGSELPLFMNEPNKIMIDVIMLSSEVKYSISDMIALCIEFSYIQDMARYLGGEVEDSIADDLYDSVDILNRFVTNVDNLSRILFSYSSMLKGGS